METFLFRGEHFHFEIAKWEIQKRSTLPETVKVRIGIELSLH